MAPDFAGTSNVRIPAWRNGHVIVLCPAAAALLAVGAKARLIATRATQPAQWKMRFMLDPRGRRIRVLGSKDHRCADSKSRQTVRHAPMRTRAPAGYRTTSAQSGHVRCSTGTFMLSSAAFAQH